MITVAEIQEKMLPFTETVVDIVNRGNEAEVVGTIALLEPQCEAGEPDAISKLSILMTGLLLAQAKEGQNDESN